MECKKNHIIRSSQDGTLKQSAQWTESSVKKRSSRRVTRIAKKSLRHGEAKAIGKIVVGLVGTIVGQRCLDETTLLMQWPVIVGHEIAAICSPIRLTFYHNKYENGILHLKVNNGSFAVVLQHSNMLLMERINGYFNRAIVGQIRITQGSLPRKIPSPFLLSHRKIFLPPAEEAALLAELAPVNDDALREALIRLGRHILLHHQRQQGSNEKLDSVEGDADHKKA